MNTSAVQYSSEPCWSRRCSIESILSIQGKETDFARDTSDTDDGSSEDVEYEPCTDVDEDPQIVLDSSGEEDNEVMIQTKVIEVSVKDDGDLEFADSESTKSDCDSEVDYRDYWRCVQCSARNNNPLYRYCERCFKVRKNLFPPRPKRKPKRKLLDTEPTTSLSQDSGICSQELVESQGTSGASNISTVDNEKPGQSDDRVRKRRRAVSADRNNKKPKLDSDSDSDSDVTSNVQPLAKKMISDPSVTVEEVKITKKVVSNTLKEKISDKTDKDDEELIDKDNNLCIVCCVQPKSGVFVHGRVAHICCCYSCAVKVWGQTKRCPICNCKVSNVLKAVVL